MSLALHDVSVAYGANTVVHDVSLRVATNEWVGLLGPNGAGKSSLLRAVAGLVDCGGSVEIDGSAPGDLSRRDRSQRIAYVAQEPVLPAGMAVLDYVLLGRTPYIPYLGSEQRSDLEAAERSLALLELGSFANRPLDGLSGGERQRVVLARALTQESSVLLLDEPTSALDIGHRQQALELIGSVRVERPMTIITAMHDLTLAGQFADRLALLSNGRLVADGAAGDVLTVANIRAHYHANVEVIGLEGGGVAVVPIRSETR